MKPFYERYEEFMGMELQNVTIVIDHDNGGFYYEAGLEAPDMYGAYLIMKDGTVEHVADFSSRAEAKYFATLIRDRFRELRRNEPFEINDKTFGDGT